MNNFVGKVDGKWIFMANISNIPEDLKENLDPEKCAIEDALYGDLTILEIE